MTRAELIAALEAAEGPSRELDAKIHCALTGQITHKYLPRGYTMEDQGSSSKNARLACSNFIHSGRGPAPRYTESIDAALSFTPEGYHWAVLKLSNNAYDATVTPKGVPPLVEEKESATPAIAICIANLRALEAQEEANG